MCKEPWGSEGFFTPKLNHQVDVLQEEQLATLEEEDGRFFFVRVKPFRRFIAHLTVITGIIS
jgi:hypothetical protein